MLGSSDTTLSLYYSQRPRGLDDDEEEQNEDDGKMLTAHGEHSRRMKGSISFNEHELLAEKPWALRGEIKSQDRPQNRYCIILEYSELTNISCLQGTMHSILWIHVLRRTVLYTNSTALVLNN